MALSPVCYAHSVLDERLLARSAGTQLRVIDLVEAKHANGWTPAQLHEQHPEMTLGQIYSALAYDWDHQEEVDAAIAAGGQALELLKRQTWSTRLGALLLQYGRI